MCSTSSKEGLIHTSNNLTILKFVLSARNILLSQVQGLCDILFHMLNGLKKRQQDHPFVEMSNSL